MALLRPTLLFDFAGQPEHLDPRISFARAGIGSYYDRSQILRYRPANAPRFSYGGGGISSGLLLERQYINRLLYSEQFDNAVWVANLATVTANTTTAPDGNLTADTLAMTGNGSLGQNCTIVAANNVAFQVYVMPAASNFARITLWDPGSSTGIGQWFDLVNNAVGSRNVSGTTITFSSADIEVLPGGWRRIRVTATTNTITLMTVFISPTAADNTPPASGNSLVAWGAQLADNPFQVSASYIPTTSAAVTRAGDAAYIPSLDPSWFNPNAGTIVGSISNSPTTNEVIFAVGGGGANFDVVNVYQQGTVIQVLANVGGTTVVNISTSGTILPASRDTPTHFAYAWAAQNYGVCANGGSVTTNTTAALIAPPVRMVFGSGAGAVPTGTGNQNFVGCLRRLAYYPTRLPNAQMQMLTMG